MTAIWLTPNNEKKAGCFALVHGFTQSANSHAGTRPGSVGVQR
jgi:hypothetical protein